MKAGARLLLGLAVCLASCGGSVGDDVSDAGDSATGDARDASVTVDASSEATPDTALADADPDAWVTAEYRGVYQSGMESSSFYAGGPCVWSDVAYWLSADDPTFYDRVSAVAPKGEMVYLRFEGRLSPPGKYGHLGGYPRQVVVTKLLDVSLLPPC